MVVKRRKHLLQSNMCSKGGWKVSVVRFDADRSRLERARDTLHHACASMGIQAQEPDYNGRPSYGAMYTRQWATMMKAIRNAMGHDGWMAVVGVPELGWAAVYEAGIDLQRCLVIDDVGDQGVTVISMLVDVCAVVMVGAVDGVTASTQRRLHTRARNSQCLLVTTRPWQGITPQVQVG